MTTPKREYEVVICALCRRQALWARVDRLDYGWQCAGPEHGYKYLSISAGTAIKIKTAEVA